MRNRQLEREFLGANGYGNQRSNSQCQEDAKSFPESHQALGLLRDLSLILSQSQKRWP